MSKADKIRFKGHKCHICDQVNVFGYSLTLRGMFETQSMSVCEECYCKINDDLFEKKNYKPKHLKRSEDE